jgi:hypothetical protein
MFDAVRHEDGDAITWIELLRIERPSARFHLQGDLVPRATDPAFRTILELTICFLMRCLFDTPAEKRGQCLYFIEVRGSK